MTPIALAVIAALQTTPSEPVLHSYGALNLSPDGKQMVSLEQSPDKALKDHMVITLRNIKGEVTGTIDPCTECSYKEPVWSADGSKLAFLATKTAKGDQLGTLSLYIVNGSKTEVVAQIPGIANHPRFSPDGKTIALLVTPNAHKQTGATQAGARQIGEIGIKDSIDEQRITTVSLADGKLSFISPDDSFVYEYDWMTQSDGFVATAAKGDGDNNWWTAKLEAFGLNGTERVIAAPKLQMNAPKVSPDGQSVAFIGGLMSDFGSVGGDVYSVALSGGEPMNLTPDYKGSFTSLKQTSSGLMASAVINGNLAITRITSKGVEILSQSQVSMSSEEGAVSLSHDGKLAAAVVETFTSAAHIEFGPVSHMASLTHDNDGFSVPFTAQSISWDNEGYKVQGWLLQPKTQAGQTYPMVVSVHGGPAAVVMPRFTNRGTVFDLLKAGYYIFMPNPRGSYGQGEAFTRANRRDFGGGDLRDILAGIDQIEKQAPVDDKRLGIMGGSYGGLMTMWTVTHSTRFKAAAAGAGIANWISYYGQNGIDQWMIPYFGASAYDDPAIYDKLSPIRTIKDAKTPTFIYVGERDIECPPAQSLEFWHGLKEQNVPTSLVIYEGEGHGIRGAEHTKDLNARTIKWFDTYLAK